MIDTNNSKIGKPFPFRVFCQKVIPLAFDESMSYLELLYSLLHYIKEVVIPAVNNNADAVAELQNLYNELKSYVDNYFENLDVQEEINNKLDEMAESGQLTDIIAQYLQLAGVLAFDNVNDMKNATNLVNGSIAKTLGFYSYNDGGGAFYKIRTITNQDDINNIDIFAITNSSDLIAELIHDNEINVLQIGCKNDNSTDISTIINYITEKADLFFPAGFYRVDNPLIIKSNIRGNFFHRDITYDIKKDVVLISNIKNELNGENNPTQCVLNISNVNYGFEMKNINIKCNSNENGIYGYYSNTNRINIRNVSVINVHNAHGIFINTENWISRLVYLDNIFIYGTNEEYANSTGIKILTSGDNRINNLEIIGCQVGFYTNTLAFGSNWHIWCGPLQGHDENEWWAGTRGITIDEGMFENIYLDSCFISIVGNNKKYQMINNLMTMNDKSMNGSTRYDGSVLYDFKGTINNWILYVDERTQYLLSEFGKFTNVQMISRDDAHFFEKDKLAGSRFMDINYGLENIPVENKLVEIAKIYCDYGSESLILNTYHAHQQYAKMRLKFINGSYSGVDVLENVGSDNYYISKNKTNNIYTIYIDMHTNGNEWIGVNVEKGVQMSHLNVINLDIKMENSDGYVPNKINYDSNILDTLI